MTPDPEAIRDLWEVDLEQEDLPDALDEAGRRPLGAATARGLYPDVDPLAKVAHRRGPPDRGAAPTCDVSTDLPTDGAGGLSAPCGRPLGPRDRRSVRRHR